MAGRKRKRIDDEDVYCVYRRQAGRSVYVRDRHGRYNCFSINNGRAVILPTGITTLAPIYGRVNFANNVRFTAHTRSQWALGGAYDNAVQYLSSGWVDLPTCRDASRRQTNQGMNGAMVALTGVARSATAYVNWAQLNGSVINPAGNWEWCHLIAHSMGGADGPGNIVAAMRGNNSEQLAIESALQMFRREDAFQMKVSVGLLDAGNGRHVGNVIRYKVRCIHGGDYYVRYLDCLNAPNPSEIHYYGVMEGLVLWANKKLLAISRFFNPVRGAERNAVIDYMRAHGH
ncbi:hypothetical protein [Frateuria sp. Soil773]|uniref:hypothetical protein n=1 Tax=Frateuria sp. Soil773 TaxID=1736407 RepID=UPI000B203DF7|nr:hypothetical protein [Frateuria sp. Soil773]